MGTLNIDGKLSVGLNNSESSACGYGIHVHDLRDATITPNSFGDRAVNYYFDQEVNGDWKGIMHFKGWSGSYAAWQISAQASNSADNTNHYILELELIILGITGIHYQIIIITLLIR